MGTAPFSQPETCTPERLRERIAEHVGTDRVPRTINIITDTSDFYRIDYDDVVVLNQRPYLIRNNEREGRFGIDEQQKFWVKRAIDLEDGSTKIIKLTFLERFNANVGDLTFECYRSPKKEARILDLVRGNSRFMQGLSTQDTAGNVVRIIDYIQGKTLADSVLTMGSSHEDYFAHHLPSVLDEFIDLVRAIKLLHDHGEIHGDIRRDHAIRDKRSGLCRWIDFDFGYFHTESRFGYDLFSLGNILVYLVARGDVTVQELRKSAPEIAAGLTPADVNIIFNNRLANLKKVYPYIPKQLNAILLHFAAGAEVFYEHTEELLADLEAARSLLAEHRFGGLK